MLIEYDEEEKIYEGAKSRPKSAIQQAVEQKLFLLDQLRMQQYQQPERKQDSEDDDEEEEENIDEVNCTWIRLHVRFYYQTF